MSRRDFFILMIVISLLLAVCGCAGPNTDLHTTRIYDFNIAYEADEDVYRLLNDEFDNIYNVLDALKKRK